MSTPYYEVGTLADEFPCDYAVFSSDYVEQRTALLTPLSRTRKVDYLFVETKTVPQSFFDALADFQAGRVVDIRVAFNEPPPRA